MRILFAAGHPPAGDVAFGGVASWVLTISKELSSRGHECVAWGPGKVRPDRRFDVGVIANATMTDRAADWCDRVVVVSHGVIPDENPASDCLTVFTSEEVRDHWGGDGDLIRQPIDLSFWKPKDQKKSKFVFYSYRAQSAFGLDDLARSLGLEFLWLKGVDAHKARKELQGAALVAASGRSALEAMACEAPTMICDWRPYNGSALVCMGLDSARHFNYSGRGGVSPREIDLETFARETMAFQRPRDYVSEHHHSSKISSELMEILKSA